MNATRVDPKLLNALCRDWIAIATGTIPEAPFDAGSAMELVIDNRAVSDGLSPHELFNAPLGIGFLAGFDLGLDLAATVISDPLDDPRSGVMTWLSKVEHKMYEMRQAIRNDAETEAQRESESKKQLRKKISLTSGAGPADETS